MDNAGVSARFGPASQYKCETGTAFNAGEKFEDIDQVGHFTCGAPEVDLITTTGNFMAYGGEVSDAAVVVLIGLSVTSVSFQ